MLLDDRKFRDDLSQWFEELTTGLELGRFRFCLEGNLAPTSGECGLFATVFAVKAAQQSGIWNCWPIERKQGALDFIHTFQIKDGTFQDPWSLNISIPKNLYYMAKGMNLKNIHKRIIIGETRQSLSTLLSSKHKPNYVLSNPFETPANVTKYLANLPWSNPWDAGSQWSTLIFTLVNSGADISFLKTAVGFLDQIYDKETGCWFSGSPNDREKLNGAMKIYTGQAWLPEELQIKQNDPLANFALKYPMAPDGCGFLNQLFILSRLIKSVPDKKHKEIVEYASQCLEYINNFIGPDGGFSFYPDKAQTHFYYRKVSKGEKVSDLHGTVLLTQAIALIDYILFESANGWQISKM